MSYAPTPSRVGLYVAIAIIVLFVLGAIGTLVFFANVMKNPEFRGAIKTVSELASAEQALEPVTAALRQYVAQKNTFPKSLDELGAYGLTQQQITETSNLFEYRQPAPNAPDDTPVLKSRVANLLGQSSTYVELTKSLEARSVSITPIRRKSRTRISFGD